MTKALLDYRSGRHAEAADSLKRLATATAQASTNNPRLHIVLSLAQHQLGQDVEARASLARARAIIWFGRRPVVGGLWDSLCTQILCREAEALLKFDDQSKLGAK